MSAQFSTYDNSSDRRDIQILFQKLGEDLSEIEANKARAKWLKNLCKSPVEVDPKQCHPVGAYCLFIQIVGVLGVSINTAAIQLTRYVARRGWHDT